MTPGRRHARMALLGVAGTLFVASPAAADIPADDLLARVEAAIVLAERGAADPSPGAMQLLLDELGLPERVTVGGTSVLVPADRLLGTLDGGQPVDFARAEDRLRALAGSLRDAARGRAAVGLRADLQAVVGRAAVPASSLVEELLRWMGDGVNGFLEAVARGATEPTGILLLVLLAGALVWALRSLGIRVVPDSAVRRGAAPAVSAVEWQARAEEALRGGDLVAAVALAYRSIVAGLADRGLVADRPSLTAGEVRAVSRELAHTGPVVERATRVYEGIRYGHRQPAPAHVGELLEAGRRVRGR